MNKILIIIRKLFGSNKKLPDEYLVPNPYEVPMHVQKDKNNCTSHAIAQIFEYKLSAYFKEKVLIDVDDLWEKQKKYGTVTEEGDSWQDAWNIADEYGMLFNTESGKKGLFRPTKGIEMI